MNIDVADVRREITPRTRAILPVHFAGRPCDMPALVSLAREHGLAVVEDARTRSRRRSTGGTAARSATSAASASTSPRTSRPSTAGCWSRRDPRARRPHCTARAARHDARTPGTATATTAFVHYEVVEPGFKYNLTDLAAALGLHQLARVDDRWQRRLRPVGAATKSALRRPPAAPAGRRPPRDAPRVAPLHLPRRRRPHVRRRATRCWRGLHALRIGAGVHYRAVHLHP